MKLEVALEIIEEQMKYVLSVGKWFDDEEDEDGDYHQVLNSHDKHGDNVSEYCVISDYALAEADCPYDKSKLFVFEEDQAGGEGCGDEYTYVFKIIHPEHGTGYIRYSGYYDSWSGTNWDSNEPTMVEPREVVVTQYFPVAA